MEEGSGLGEDNIVEQLSEEELHCVLKQLIDHNLPENKKCGLVQRLKREDQKKANGNEYSTLLEEESEHHRRSLGSRHSSSVRNSCRSGPGSKGVRGQSESLDQHAQPARQLTGICDDSGRHSRQPAISSQQQLRASESRKPNRANSFTTMPSDNPCKGKDSSLQILTHPHQHHHLIPAGEVSPEMLRAAADKQTQDGSGGGGAGSNQQQPVAPHHNATSSGSTRPTGPVLARLNSSNSSHQFSPSDHSADLHSYTNHLSPVTKSSSSTSQAFSSPYLARINSLVESIGPQATSHKSNNQSLAVQEEDYEQSPSFGEMRTLHSRANIVEYRNDRKLTSLVKETNNHNDNNNIAKHAVDQPMEMALLSNNNGGSSSSSKSVEEHPFHQSIQGIQALSAFSNSSMSYPSSSFYHQYNGQNSSNGNRLETLKAKRQKRKEKEGKNMKLAKDYDGHLGEDVDHVNVNILEEFITGNSTDVTSLIDLKKKGIAHKLESEPAKRPKRKNGEIKVAQNEEKCVLVSKSNKVSLSYASPTTSTCVNGGSKLVFGFFEDLEDYDGHLGEDVDHVNVNILEEFVNGNSTDVTSLIDLKKKGIAHKLESEPAKRPKRKNGEIKVAQNEEKCVLVSNSNKVSLSYASPTTSTCVNGGSKLVFGFFEDLEDYDGHLGGDVDHVNVNILEEFVTGNSTDVTSLIDLKKKGIAHKLESEPAKRPKRKKGEIKVAQHEEKCVLVSNSNKVSLSYASNEKENKALLQTSQPFISCVNELSNYRFIDNLDKNSFNYANVIQFVYISWNNCKTTQQY